MTILWDWNGTLLDDTDACVASLNLMLERRGVKPITLEFYRREFAFPVRSFYEKIGVRLEDEDWDRLATPRRSGSPGTWTTYTGRTT